jgi:hypothetical protein
MKKQAEPEKIGVADFKSVRPNAKPFIEKILLPFLTVKFAEKGQTFNANNISPYMQDLIFEELRYHLNDVFSAFREEAQEKKKKSTFPNY